MKPSKAQRGRLEGVGEAANETQGGKILFANRASLKHKPAQRWGTRTILFTIMHKEVLLPLNLLTHDLQLVGFFHKSEDQISKH